MKVLSIIGMVISTLGLIMGFAACASNRSDVQAAGVMMLFLSSYFLVFSIIAMVVSFKKKKN
jgi:hypothetical protein